MIEVLTILTKQTMSKYSRYNLFRNKLLIIFIPLLLLTFSVIFIILDQENLALPIVGAGLAIAVPLAVVAANEISTNMLYRKIYTQKETPYIRYFFNQNNFEFENNFGDLITTSVLNYNNIINCLELNDFFYLYISKDYAYIVDKKGFKQGKVIELSELLRFKCQNYKKNIKDPR